MLAIFSNSQASVIMGATSVATTSGSTTAVDITNQSGLATNYTSGITNFFTYTTASPSHSGESEGNYWSGGFAGFVTIDVDINFDLGTGHQLNSLALWNEVNIGQSIKNVSLFAGLASDFSDAVLVGNFSATDTSSSVNNIYTSQLEVFNFSSVVDAHYVRLNITSIYGAPLPTIVEVAFSSNGGSW